MLEEFYRYKALYKDSVILIKVGNFYEILDKDAMILNKVLGYKLTKLSNTLKCGFPVSSLSKVKEILDEKHLNYVVVENGELTCNKDFKDKNIYNSFDFNIDSVKYSLFRIEKITKYLNNNAYNNVSDLLDEIEVLINGR